MINALQLAKDMTRIIPDATLDPNYSTGHYIFIKGQDAYFHIAYNGEVRVIGSMSDCTCDKNSYCSPCILEINQL